MKRMIWTVLAAALSTTAAALAVKGLATAWLRLTGEDPPRPSRLTRLLIGKPLRLAGHRVEPAAM